MGRGRVLGARCETLKLGPFRGHSAPSGLSADRPGRSGDAAQKALGPERSGISRLRVSGGRNVRRPPPSGLRGLRRVVQSSAGQDRGEKFLHGSREGGTLARPNHCRRGGGYLSNSTVLTRALTPILQVPPADLASIREGSLFPFRDTEKPCPHLLAPSPPRSAHIPTSHGAVLVAGHAVAGGAVCSELRRLLSWSLQATCCGVGGWNDAGPESLKLRPPDRGGLLCHCAARAAGG